MAARNRRTLIADAIIDTLAVSGGRGLTHRAVDEAAGLPLGSTSYYHRSRASLLEAAVGRLAELDSATIAEADATDPVDALVGIVLDVVSGQGRARTLARYELSLEAVRRPELARVLAAGTAQLEAAIADRLEQRMPRLDAERRASDLLAFLDGLLFAEVTGTASSPRTPDDIRAAVVWLLATTPGGP